MNDLITAATSGLFVEVGKVIEHMKAQASRIADLERQLAEASPPACLIEPIVMPQKVHVHHIAAIAKCSGIFGLVSMSEIQKFALALLNEFSTAAPSAPAVEQQPVASDGWLIDGSLVYKLDPTGTMNLFEINVTQAEGSRKHDGPRIELAKRILEWLTTSATALGQQPMAYAIFATYEGTRRFCHAHSDRQSADAHVSYFPEERKAEVLPLYTAPQAADTDKVREALPVDLSGLTRYGHGEMYIGDDCDFGPRADGGFYSVQEVTELVASTAAQASAQQDVDKVGEAILALRCNPSLSQSYKGGYVDALHAASELVINMAAQAPVREVPETYKLVPIRPNWNMLDALYGKGWIERSPAEQVGMLQAYRNMLDAAALNLPAAPVQQEGASNA